MHTHEVGLMPNQIISFRSQTKGEVSDFIEVEGLTCQPTQNIISHLAGSLLRYHEEGKELNPVVLYCESADSLISSLPGSTIYEIGQAPLTAESVKRILKDCATLATVPWSIWIERTNGETLRYGVFSYMPLPTSITLYEALNVINAKFAILVRKISHTTVGIFGSKGNSLSLVFSTIRDESAQSSLIDTFTRDCSAGVAVNGDDLSAFRTFMRNLIDRALSASHGTILVTADSQTLFKLKEIGERVILNPKLDFYSAFKDYRTIQSAEAILRLQSMETLLYGFVNSDGIVALDACAKVHSYRIFYKGSKKDDNKEVGGGARRKAFEGLRSHVGNGINSVLFRSQDGLMLYDGAAQNG